MVLSIHKEDGQLTLGSGATLACRSRRRRIKNMFRNLSLRRVLPLCLFCLVTGTVFLGSVSVNTINDVPPLPTSVIVRKPHLKQTLKNSDTSSPLPKHDVDPEDILKMAVSNSVSTHNATTEDLVWLHSTYRHLQEQDPGLKSAAWRRKKPLKIIMISKPRSGTSFTGDLLSSHPGTFYHFEPFFGFHSHWTNMKTTLEPDKAIAYLRSLLQCYEGEKGLEILSALNPITSNYRATWNKYHWEWNCARGAEAYKKKTAEEQKKEGNIPCLKPSRARTLCSIYPLQFMKLNRVDVQHIGPLLEDDTMDVRIIHLVRDPRGIVSSRKAIKIHFCFDSVPECSDPAVWCPKELTSVMATYDLMKRFPGRVLLLRYEDLAATPTETAAKVFQLLSLSLMEPTIAWIQNHTTNPDSDNFSTFRKSQERIAAWKTSLSFEEVERVQEKCWELMEELGYLLMNNEEEMQNPDFKTYKPWRHVPRYESPMY